MDIAGKGIYRISAAMAAGAAACALAAALPIHDIFTYIAAGTAMAALASSAAGAGALLRSAGKMRDIARSGGLWTAVFVVAGAFCYLTSSITGQGAAPLPVFMHARDTMTAIVHGIPFSDTENNDLVCALIFGDRSGLGRSTVEAFRRAGAAHLLALSGMHLGIIYLIVGKALALLGNSIPARRIRSIATIILTGLYTLLCGAGASLVRAWLFILLAESAKILERPQEGGQIFCAALTLHLIISPASISTPGFQLSYLAMVGIVFIWPHMRQWFGKAEGEDEFPLMHRVWDAASLSISCQLFTAPLTLLYFGTFPKLFLVTNLFAAPLMGVVMICAVAATGCAAADITAPWLYTILETPITLLRELLSVISELS